MLLQKPKSLRRQVRKLSIVNRHLFSNCPKQSARKAAHVLSLPHRRPVSSMLVEAIVLVRSDISFLPATSEESAAAPRKLRGGESKEELRDLLQAARERHTLCADQVRRSPQGHIRDVSGCPTKAFPTYWKLAGLYPKRRSDRQIFRGKQVRRASAHV